MAVTGYLARSRPIRVFLIIIFAVPLVSLIGLWAFAASITVPEAVNDHNFNVDDVIGTSPDVATLTLQLPVEQQETYLWLLSGRKGSNAALLTTRKSISNALPGGEAALPVGSGQLSASGEADLNTLEADLRSIPGIRQSVDAGTMTPTAAFQAYSNITNAEFQYYYDEAQGGGTSMQAVAIGTIDAVLEMEMITREATLVDGAVSADRDRMDAAARQLFISSATNRQFLMSQALSLLTPSIRDRYAAVVNSPTYQQFQTLENQIMSGSGNGPIMANPAAWDTASGSVLGAMLTASGSAATQLSTISNSASRWLYTKAIIAGGVGLVAVIVSVTLLVWFGRKVTGDLTGLFTSVRGMAEERLPRVVERLRRGDDVDVLAESPPPDTSDIQEISQIARSFGIVQEAAVAAAVEQARLRKGVSQVFLNISMRNQSLLHRQLGMLDSMERQTSEPGALADLFRLDHLTTRMRRHAEGLIILSGATPGRGWRDPVPVVDVLRAAIAEVEDYVRVDVLSESSDLVAGNAVNDVIHLVAELVENATAFSPPTTRIDIRADRVGTGLVAEIEDRGLGISREELDTINARLANPPEFDLANSEQLGLFIVSRLAARHGIRVSLRQSAYGGTTAILVLPFGVIVREEDAASNGGRGDGPAAGQPGGTGTVSPPSMNGSALTSSGPLPGFGLTGRHRVAASAPTMAAPTAGMADAGTDAGPAGRGGEDPLRTSRPLPRAPWEYVQPEPQAREVRIPAPEAQPPAPEVRPSAPSKRPLWETGPFETAAGDTAMGPWSGAFSRPPVLRGPERPGDGQLTSAPGAGRGQQAPAAASPGSHLGMPIRVPQASLAPQLRDHPDGDQQPAGNAGPDAAARSPEATRNMMILMQQGWERGRVDELDDPGGISDSDMSNSGTSDRGIGDNGVGDNGSDGNGNGR